MPNGFRPACGRELEQALVAFDGGTSDSNKFDKMALCVSRLTVFPT